MVRTPTNSKLRGQVPFLFVLIALLVVAIAVVSFMGSGTTADRGNGLTPEDGPTEVTRQDNATPDPVATGSTETANNRIETDRFRKDSTSSRLPRGSAVRGMVINSENEPIPGATVIVTEQANFGNMPSQNPSASKTGRFEVRTDKSGNFNLSRLPIGVQFSMWVHHPEYAPTLGVSLRALPDEIQELQPIVLNSGYRIHGSVSDEAGNPLQGVEVAVQLHATMNFGHHDQGHLALEEASGRLRRVITDGNGEFSVGHLARGIYQIEASLEDFASSIENAVQCMGEEFLVERHLVMGTEHRLAGLVRDEAGNPIPDALVAAARIRPRPIYSCETRTDENGNFELRGLPEGAYGLNTMPEGFAPARLTHVQSNRTDIELVVRQKGGVSGIVNGPRGEIVNSFTMELFRVNQGTAQYGVTQRKIQVNDPDGAYKFTNLDRGSYVLLVRAQGHSPTYSPGFFVDREIQEGVNVVMQVGGTLSGTISDPSGNPLPGAKVTLRGRDYKEWNRTSLLGGPIGDPNNVPEISVKTDSKGRFSLENAFPGEHQLEASHSYFLTTYAGVSIMAGRTSQVGDIQVQKGATITGIVSTKSGRVAAGATILLSLKDSDSGFFSRKALSDAKGRFQYGGLQPGLYEVSAVREDSSMFMFPGISPGSSRDVYLKLGHEENVKLVIPEKD